MLAVAAGAAGAFEVSVEVMLVKLPFGKARTFALMVQVELAARVPPDRDMLPAVAVTVPPQVSASPLGLATTNKVGRVSVNARPVSGVAFGFTMVNVKVVVPPAGTVAPPNALVKDGAVSGAEPAASAGQNPASLSVTRAPVVTLYVQ